MTTRTVNPTTPIESSTLIRAGLIAAAAAAVTALIVFVLATSVLNITILMPPDMTPMPFFAVIVASIVGAIGGTIVLAALSRFVANPVTTFRYVALGFLLFSLVPPLTMPDLETGSRLGMVALHFAAGLPIIAVLTTQLKK